MVALRFLSVAFCSLQLANCAQILAWIPSPFYSHQAAWRPLWRELAARGHKLTLVTTNLMKPNENITQIDYSKTYDIFEKHNMFELFRKGYGMIEIMKKFVGLMNDIYDFQLSHPEMTKLIRSKKKFDLMIIEVMLPLFPSLSAHFGCPYIGVSSMDAQPMAHAQMGNAIHPALYPYVDFAFGEKLTFHERLVSTLYVASFPLLGKIFLEMFTEDYLDKYVSKNLPSLHEVAKNMSLLFTIANPIFFAPRPSTPTTINLGGGLHLKPPEKLPQVGFDHKKERSDRLRASKIRVV